MSHEESKREIILSRYFDDNTYLVAGMCWKCYRDCSDLKIVGVNHCFLKQTKEVLRNRNLARDHDGFFFLDDNFAFTDHKLLDNCGEAKMGIPDGTNDIFSVESGISNENKTCIAEEEIKKSNKNDDLSSGCWSDVSDEYQPQIYNNNGATDKNTTPEGINKDFPIHNINEKESLTTFTSENGSSSKSMSEIECQHEFNNLKELTQQIQSENYENDSGTSVFLGFDSKDITDSNTLIKTIDISFQSLEGVLPNMPETPQASLSDGNHYCSTYNTDIVNTSSIRDDDQKYSSFFDIKKKDLCQNEYVLVNIKDHSHFVKNITLNEQVSSSDKQFEEISANHRDVMHGLDFKSDNIQEPKSINNKINCFIDEIEDYKLNVVNNEKLPTEDVSFQILKQTGNDKVDSNMKEESKSLEVVTNSATRSKFFKNNNGTKYGIDDVAVENLNFPKLKHRKINSTKLKNNSKIEESLIKQELFEPLSNDNFLIEPIWHPPKSPHDLIEEHLYHDPWSLLVATIFLNKTAAKYAKPHIVNFLRDYPTPFEVIKSDVSHLEQYFEKIGLKKRSVQIFRMSHDFIYKNWRDVGELYGIGRYGRDAFNMFCLGNFEVEPKDRYLRIYKAWYQRVYLKEVKTDVDFDQKFTSVVKYKDEEWCHSEEESEESFD